MEIKKLNLLFTLFFLLCVVTPSAFSNGNVVYKKPPYGTIARATYGTLDNYIVLHSIPPANRIVWKSARSVLLSYAANLTNKKLTGRANAMGHLTFEIACTTAPGKRRHIFSGQAEQDLNGFYESLKEGEGFNIFFKAVPGKLQDGADLARQYTKLTNIDERMAIAVFDVDAKTCTRALNFYDKYVATQAYTNYGLMLKPHTFEGGGCASVGAAIISAAFVHRPDVLAKMGEWRQNIRIPLNGFGTQEKKVKLSTLIFGKYSFKLDGPATDMRISFYDPHLVYAWTLKMFNRAADNTVIDGINKRFYINKTPVIIFNYNRK